MILIDNDDRKQERREDIVCVLRFVLIEIAQRPARIETVWPKKPRVNPGFEPGPLRQKSDTLPLALPPRPDRKLLRVQGLT